MEDDGSPLNNFGKGLKKLFGKSRRGSGEDLTEQEIMSMVNEGHEHGVLQESEAEMINNIFTLDQKEAKDIMVIGAGDGGVVRELTRYDRVRHIDLVEMDPMVVEACRAYLPENACRLDDRRVHLHYENALRFIRRCEAKYDLIIVDSSDPFGPSEGLFTREFYGNCYNALKEDGIMVNQQGSPFYAEDAHAM